MKNNNKYRNKDRNTSSRLRNWDYGWAAPYFITICTYDKTNYFGKIINDEVHLSPIGRIVDDEWKKTFALRPDMNLTMGTYVVMPNHFHAIIIIGKNEYNQFEKEIKYDKYVECLERNCVGCIKCQGCLGQILNNNSTNIPIFQASSGAMHCAATGLENNVVLDIGRKNKFGPQSKNLSSIVRGFKSAVTIGARKIQTDFKWQARFHDHLIKDQNAFKNIKYYIINNPSNWEKDEFY